MQTAYTIHNGTGPSQRVIVATKATGGMDGDDLELAITVTLCDDQFKPKETQASFTSIAHRAGFKSWIKQEPSGEANYHYKLRNKLESQHNWRFEVNPALSDPL